MTTFKITVLKRMSNQDLADEYCGVDAEVPCPHFDDGQEFVLERGGPPEGFCGWAWNDIRQLYQVLRNGGSTPSMRDKNVLVACCTDGIRPVAFKLERIDG
jgi:uncharacterized repeat protein (TIGR04076 family)